MAKKPTRKSARKGTATRAKAVTPRRLRVTTAQANRILDAQGFTRTVTVVRDRIDQNVIREILIRE